MKKDNFLRFYNKYRLYIFPFVVALSNLVLIIFVIFPQTTSYLQNQNTENELRNKQDLLEVKAAELEKYDGQDLKEKLNIALSVYPPDKDYSQVIGILQDVTGKSGYSLLALQLGQSSVNDEEGSQRFSVRIDVAGSSESFSRFLTSLETYPRVMKVSSFDINPGKARGLLGASIVLDVFFSPAPPALGAVDTPLSPLSQEEEELIVSLVRSVPRSGSFVQAPLLPRGKANPFE